MRNRMQYVEVFPTNFGSGFFGNNKEESLEQQLEDAERLVNKVQHLATKGNPFGALHIIEIQEEQKRTAALYGIVREGIEGEIAMQTAQNPEYLASIKDSGAFELYEQLLGYCTEKMQPLFTPKNLGYDGDKKSEGSEIPYGKGMP